MEPFFSIIIPTYNRAALLAKAIDSVLVQTFQSWELIIVDDGSVDNTREVVQSYSDPRVRYIYQQNAERSRARNNGIENSTGTYICFLDSDDYYLPERLDLLHGKLAEKNFPVTAFYTGKLLEQNGQLTVYAEKPKDNNIYDHLALSVIHSQQCCIHSRILKEYKYDPAFHIGEDLELWLRIAEKFPFVYLPGAENIVVVDHDDRSVNIKKYNSFPDQMRMLNRIFSADHPGRNISVEVKRALKSNCYFGIAKYAIYTEQRAPAIKNLLLAIAAAPGHFQNKYRINLIVQLLLPGGFSKAKKLLE